MKMGLPLLAGGALAAVGLAGAAGAAGLHGTSAAARGSAEAAAVRIVYVNNASSAGPFAAVIRNGFETACRLYEVDCSYRATTNTTFDPAEEARLIDRAVADKPDGLMVTDSSPKALNPHIRAAVLAGIPVILDNTGLGQAGAPTGALTYVGNDERESGRLAGDLLAGAGVKRLLVIAVEPGLPLADDRLAGLRQGSRGAVKVTTIRVARADLGKATKVRGLIDRALRRDPAIDGVFSIGQLFNAPMLAERAALGPRAARIRWASIDLGPEVVAALQRGRMEFALDQQQWLQGYLPVEFLAFYARYGFTPPTPFVRTGPSVVTPRTIGKYVAALRNGMR